MNKGKKFLSWLEKQTKRDDPIGDLASDFISDLKRKPVDTFADLYTSISSTSGSSSAMETLKEAWREFNPEPFPIADEESKKCENHEVEGCDECEHLW